MFASPEMLLLAAPVILLSLTVHEYCHGRMALHFGDDTAQRMGRLTLNPIAHLDLMGTLCMLFVGFGWAKPVPINKANFREPRKADILVSAVGPLSNLVLAVLFGLLFHAVLRVSRFTEMPGHTAQILATMAMFGVFCNIGLFLFNLLPLFPLDGSHVAENLLPFPMSQRFGEFGRHYGGMILLALVLLDNFGVSPVLDWLLRRPRGFLVHAILGQSGNWI